MFNFTTQTVYNYLSTTGANQNVWIPEDQDAKPEVRIGNTRFNVEDILDVQVKMPTAENLASVTFDMSKVVIAQGSDVNELTARVVLYVGLSMNSQDSFYANDLVYKGKPLFVEFPVKKGDDAAAIATKAAAIAKKYFLFTAQEKILNVTAESGNLTFKGVNGYQQIKKAVLQVFDPEAKSIDCCANQGDYIDKVTGVPVMYEVNTEEPVNDGDPAVGDVVSLHKVYDGANGTSLAQDGSEVEILPGLEAFGDYNWIIHNLRLPTLANTNFWAPTKEEMPAPGATYVQVIIRMCKERDGIVGEIVGARAKSVTTHVLYVNSACWSDFQTHVLNVIAPNSSWLHDADDKLQTPFGEDDASTSGSGGN